jgi:hypothetical protein
MFHVPLGLTFATFVGFAAPLPDNRPVTFLPFFPTACERCQLDVHRDFLTSVSPKADGKLGVEVSIVMRSVGRSLPTNHFEWDRARVVGITIKDEE